MDNTPATSPLVNKPVIIDVEQKTMDFPAAIKEVILGKKIHKLEWKDKEFYGILDTTRLRLHKPDGRLYDWLLSDGDLLGEDWIII